MKPSLTVMTLGVEDPKATHTFFSGGLGWAAALYDPDEVVFYQVGPGLLLSFFRRDLLAAEAGATAPAATAPVTLGHNVDSPGAVDTVLAEAAAAGGTVIAPGTQRSWGGYSGYFADPDGFRWEVAWNPGLAVDSDGKVSIRVVG